MYSKSDHINTLRIVLFFALFWLVSQPSYAQHWTVKVTNSGTETTVLTYGGVAHSSTSSWTNSMAILYIDSDLSAAEEGHYTQNVTFTATFKWVDAQGNPAPNPPATISFIAIPNVSWNTGYNGTGTYSAPIISTNQASDGMNDPYVAQPWNGLQAGGYCKGKHVVLKVPAGSTTVTWTCQQSLNIDITNPTSPLQQVSLNVGGGTGLAVCTGPTPSPPDELWNSDPVLLYHGTARTFADQIVSGLQLGPKGTGDFGLGFYTLGTSTGSGDGLTGAQYAQKMALRAVRNTPNKDWGVIRFEAPLSNMLDFFCTYQDIILGYGYATPDTDRLNGIPPWNAPIYFPNNPPDSLAQPIPAGPMNWYNFCWYNWYLKRCIYGVQVEDDEGSVNYVPLWDGSEPPNGADWRYAMTWGRFFMPPKWYDGCNPFQLGPGPLQSGHIQHTWGTGGGINFLNQTNVVKRYLDSYGTASSGWSLTITPTQTVGGNTVTGTIAFSGPHIGTTISLSSDNACASLPASVTVPLGAGSASFTILTTAVTQPTNVHITAGDTQTSYGVTLQVQPH